MTLQEVKTVSVSKQINGIGDTLDIKESKVTIMEDQKVDTADGLVYDKQGGYVGSFNYNRTSSISVNLNDGSFTVLQVNGEILKYIDAIENQVSVSMN